ncbi:hypothetical protein GCM10027430_12900 [Lysobacter tyrosinilyticus]
MVAHANAQTLTAERVIPATTPVTSEPTAQTAPAASRLEHVFAAGTLVELEILTPINSSQHKRGDKFGLRLASPLVHDGAPCVPAGTLGVGQVVHAMPAHGGGKPGELLLAGRYLDFGGQQIPLRGMKAGAVGDANYGAALGTAFAIGPFAMFIRGHEIEIPAGTRVTAKLAQDLVLQACSASVVDPPATPNQE